MVNHISSLEKYIMGLFSRFCGDVELNYIHLVTTRIGPFSPVSKLWESHSNPLNVPLGNLFSVLHTFVFGCIDCFAASRS